MQFGTKIDRFVQYLSVGLIIFLVAIFFVVHLSEAPIEVQYLSLAIFIGIPGITYLFAPRGFIIDQDGIAIKRILGSIRIKHTDIQGITRLDKFSSTARGNLNWKFLGSNGFFGYYGYLFMGKRRTYHLFLSSLEDIILIETEKRKYLLSPYPVDSFLSYLHSFVTNITMIEKEEFP